MGYESKLIIVEKWSFKGASSLGETIAELNLSKMGKDFFPIDETFEMEVDKPIYLNGEEITEDKYGEKLRCTSVEKLLKVLYRCESECHYRRTELAINTLKTFQSKGWEDVVVVHYGY